MSAIGKITGSHGVKGQVIFEHSLKHYNDFSDWDALLIELLPGSQIPFFIEEIKKQNDSNCLVKLEEINSPEDAHEIVQRPVFLSPNISLSEEQIDIETDTFIGYLLFDKKTEIGVIDNILNPKTNPLFIIHEDEENELLIPANEELIISIDNEKRVIVADLPEGLY